MNLINFDDLDFKGAFGVSLTCFASQALLDYSEDLDELDDTQVLQLLHAIGAEAIVAVDKMLEEAEGTEELEIDPLVDVFEKYTEIPGYAEHDAVSVIAAARGFYAEIMSALFRQDHYADGDEALAVFAAEPVKDESADGELG